MTETISCKDLFSARKNVYRFAYQTPTLMCGALSRELGVPIYSKLEITQPTGSFKVRGASNRLLSMSPSDLTNGVTAVSTGNHGRAVAYVAKSMGIPSRIFVSQQVPEGKLAAIRSLGVTLEVVGASYDEAFAYANDISAKEGMTLVPPFDDRHVIAGQGSIGLELLEQLPHIKTCIVPLSGGGLIAGIALALKSISPTIRVIGVSMENGAAMYASLKANKPVEVAETDTVADSLKGGIGLNNRFTLDMVKRYVDDVVLVDEASIVQAIGYAAKDMKWIIEGASAVSIAALLGGKITATDATAIILSGQNIDRAVLEHAMR